MSQRAALDCAVAPTGEPGSPSAHICVGEVTGGYAAQFLSPVDLGRDGSAGVESVIVVDVGGPIDSIDLMRGELLRAGQGSGSTEVLLGLTPPPLDRPLVLACVQATAATLVEACDLTRRAEVHTRGYAEALGAALELADLADTKIDLAGSSYASARWAQIFAGGHIVDVRHAAVMQPFPLGMDGADLDARLSTTVRALATAVILEGCVTEACLEGTGIGSFEACRTGPCSPEAEIADLVGRPPSEVVEGLAGLAPTMGKNAAQLRSAYQAGDAEAVSEMIDLGRASYHGRDPLGGLRVEQVDFLAAVCPTLQPSELGSRFALCEDVPRSPAVEEGPFSGRWADPGVVPQWGCFASTSPDPVLGSASMEGVVFGENVERFAVEPWWGHGDIVPAVEMLRAMRRGPGGRKPVCPRSGRR